MAETDDEEERREVAHIMIDDLNKQRIAFEKQLASKEKENAALRKEIKGHLEDLADVVDVLDTWKARAQEQMGLRAKDATEAAHTIIKAEKERDTATYERDCALKHQAKAEIERDELKERNLEETKYALELKARIENAMACCVDMEYATNGCSCPACKMMRALKSEERRD